MRRAPAAVTPLSRSVRSGSVAVTISATVAFKAASNGVDMSKTFNAIVVPIAAVAFALSLMFVTLGIATAVKGQEVEQCFTVSETMNYMDRTFGDHIEDTGRVSAAEFGVFETGMAQAHGQSPWRAAGVVPDFVLWIKVGNTIGYVIFDENGCAFKQQIFGVSQPIWDRMLKGDGA